MFNNLKFEKMKLSKFNFRNTVVVTLMTTAIMLTSVACSEDEEPIIENPIETVDIVETAIAGNPDEFNTLVQAVVAADLVSTLKGDGPFTVFAPTDEAFSKLPAGTVEGLLKDIPALKNILTYHVVEGDVKAADVIKLTSAKTLQGAEVAIDAANGVKINDATVIKADVLADNGVIHVIDTVLLPA